jgi:predicted phosphoadenosine phosphosulfate sulfurtransferase
MKINHDDINVLDAARLRIKYCFEQFDNIYFCISGGKDSSVMIQLAIEYCKENGHTFSILFIDLEAQYNSTITHVLELLELSKPYIKTIYWICLPLSLRNSVSIIQTKWICWDEQVKDIWVRNMPEYPFVININNLPNELKWFKIRMEFEEFIQLFAQYFNILNGGKTGIGVAIRSDESFNRFRTIVNNNKKTYENIHWTTQLKIKNRFAPIYNFYPIYDWKTEDIWGQSFCLN